MVTYMVNSYLLYSTFLATFKD